MARGLLLLMLLYGWHASAATTPARLTEGPDSIAGLLRIPDGLEPGRYVIQCEAWVRKKGRAGRFICYSTEEGQRAIVDAVAAAGRRAKFVPATRDGAAADVYMLLMVRIDISDREPVVVVAPNNGVEAERYGLSYIAPQRFNEFTWNAKQIGIRTGRVLIWQKLHIDEYGKVQEYLVTNAGDAPQYLVERIEEQVKRMEFMPGYFEGKPVPMFYVEPVLD